MRDRPLDLKDYNLGKWEYREMQAICRQYAKYLAILPRMSDPMRPEADRLVQCITEAATATRGRRDEGAWRESILETCCRGKPYRCLHAWQLPTTSQAEFYAARREFFWRLWQAVKFGEQGKL